MFSLPDFGQRVRSDGSCGAYPLRHRLDCLVILDREGLSSDGRFPAASDSARGLQHHRLPDAAACPSRMCCSRCRSSPAASWPVTLADVMLALGIVLLLLEVVKGARPGSKFLMDHLLSLIRVRRGRGRIRDVAPNSATRPISCWCCSRWPTSWRHRRARDAASLSPMTDGADAARRKTGGSGRCRRRAQIRAGVCAASPAAVTPRASASVNESVLWPPRRSRQTRIRRAPDSVAAPSPDVARRAPANDAPSVRRTTPR